jgi:pyruvate dehydrogenase E2 component (dihydrolipoamide acetyltransferase)
MPNLELKRKKGLSLFRRMAIGTWRTAYDPSVYGTLEVPMEQAMAYIERYRQVKGKRLTVTHLMAKAVAGALQRMPDANAVLRFNRIYLRDRISVFMQVVMTDEGEGKVDLSGVRVHDADQKTLDQIVDEVQEKIALVRKRQDPELEKGRNLLRFVPSLLLNAFLRMISFLTIVLNLDLRWAGIPKDPFGSIMVTNIGSLGLDLAYVPLVPYSRVGMLLAMGAVQDVPLVENGEVVVRKRMKVNATFDHRFIDGYHAAIMAKTLTTYFSEPEKHFGAI